MRCGKGRPKKIEISNRNKSSKDNKLSRHSPWIVQNGGDHADTSVALRRSAYAAIALMLTHVI